MSSFTKATVAERKKLYNENEILLTWKACKCQYPDTSLGDHLLRIGEPLSVLSEVLSRRRMKESNDSCALVDLHKPSQSR